MKDNDNNMMVDNGSNDTDDDSRIRVYLRLRPMNKLEESKRSKDCVEMHDNPKTLTVDSPLQGTFDFSFDMVGNFLLSYSCYV